MVWGDEDRALRFLVVDGTNSSENNRDASVIFSVLQAVINHEIEPPFKISKLMRKTWRAARTSERKDRLAVDRREQAVAEWDIARSFLAPD